MTKRAERIYLSFFENDNQDNGQRMAAAIRQALLEVNANCIHSDQPRDLEDELRNLCDELEDPNLLTGIYGNCYD